MKTILYLLLFFYSSFVSSKSNTINQQRPVTVTIEVKGGFIRTDRWEDPSTCRTFDRIICDPTYANSICYTITYTYDDGTIATNGLGLDEGQHQYPIYVKLIKNDGQVINEGLVSFYDYTSTFENNHINSLYQFTFENCGN
ncbi:MAG: hypothetical protein IT243_02385 [Bacteroidia bacterium]|nr:hypothetical protein [Bacteroidia bacterium]